MLIGLDSYWSFVTRKVRRGEAGPIAISTQLGWVLSGTMMMPREPCQSLNLLTHVLKIDVSSSEDDCLEEVLQSFWRLESLGIAGSEESVLD